MFGKKSTVELMLLLVILQAMKQEPPLDAKCRDKFLVQSVPITGDREFANLASIVSNAVVMGVQADITGD
jgi:hypothetical protein